MTIKRLLQLSAIGTACMLGLILVVSLMAVNSAKVRIERLVNVDQVRLIALTDAYAQGLQMGQATRNFLLSGKDNMAIANYGRERTSSERRSMSPAVRLPERKRKR